MSIFIKTIKLCTRATLLIIPISSIPHLSHAQNLIPELVCVAKERNKFSDRTTEANVTLKVTKIKDTIQIKIETPEYLAWQKKNKDATLYEIVDAGMKAITLDFIFQSPSAPHIRKFSFDKSQKDFINLVEVWDTGDKQIYMISFDINRMSGDFIYREYSSAYSIAKEVSGICEKQGPKF